MRVTKNAKMSTKPRGNAGFTSAEVLITLGIVGIVAEMTLPGLIYDINNNALKTAWIKSYSAIAQATQSMISDNGGTFPWSGRLGGCTGDAMTYYPVAMKDIANYYNTNKIIVTGDCGNLISSMRAAYGSTFSGIKKPDASVDSFTNQSGNGLILNDGSFIFYSVESNGPLWHSVFPSINIPHATLGGWWRQIWVDVNGAKPPNAWGKDFFMINVYEKGMAPVGSNPTQLTLDTCNATGSNYVNCGAWIIQNHDYKVPF